MHIEKNIFENIFNTMMDVKNKTKDNIKSREDLKIFCKRPELESIESNERIVKPKTSFTLSKEQKGDVCLWLKDLKFSYGYASNISRCVNVDDNRVFGFKRHDCNVFMERLLLIVLRDLLPTPVWMP